MTVGATSEEELERIIARGRTQGRDLRAAQGPPRPVRRRDPPPLSQGPARGASRATTSTTCLPENGVPRRPAPLGHGGDLRHRARGQPAPGPQPGRQVVARPRLSRRLQRGRSHRRRSSNSKPIGLEGLDDVLVARHEEEGHPPARMSLCLPEGGGWLLVEFGGESKDESDGKAHDSDGPPEEDEATRRR